MYCMRLPHINLFSSLWILKTVLETVWKQIQTSFFKGINFLGIHSSKPLFLKSLNNSIYHYSMILDLNCFKDIFFEQIKPIQKIKTFCWNQHFFFFGSVLSTHPWPNFYWKLTITFKEKKSNSCFWHCS